MKLSNYFTLLLASLLLAWGGLSGCKTPEEEQEEPTPEVTEPSVEIAFASSDANSAAFTVKTAEIAQIAYAAFAGTPDAEQTEDVLFMNGTTAECKDGDNSITVSGLEPNTNYTLYVAATTVDDEYYGEVVTQDFSTGDYEQDVTLVDVGYNNFTVHVKVPESVKENGNVLRFSYGNLVMYNSNKSGWMASTDAQTLEANGGLFMVNDSTIYYGPENEVLINEYGEEVVLHDPIVPGEPMIFLVGEFAWGESMYGWGEGWYSAMFDNEAYQEALWNSTGDVNEEDYWTGYFHKMQITARQPEVLNATVDVDASNVQAVTGSIKFTPDPDVHQYCVLVTDEISYAQILDLIDGNEEYLQWFTSSYYASFMLGMRTFKGNTEIDLTEYLYLQEQTKYHILVTAMGDAEGTSQSFQHIEFTTTEKTLEAPEVTVTAIDNPYGPEDPFQVWFNVKNTGTVDVVSAMYAANYERDWAAALQYMTYADVTASGNALTADQVALINSPEGLNLGFATIDGMTTRLAVLAYNIEQTPNVLEEGCPAIADNTADFMPDAERVESGLFSALEGEWTMTADVAHYDYYEGGYVNDGSESIKVTIYDGINDYPETLPSEVYDYYAGMTKEEVDALFVEWWKYQYHPDLHTKAEMLERWFGNVLDDDRVHGVSFPLYGTSTSAVGELTDDSVGLTVTPSTEETAGQDDFAKLPQFWCLEVSAEKNADGSHEIYYVEHIDSMKNVRSGEHLTWVLQKNTWTREWDEGGYRYLKMRCHPAPGYEQWPDGEDKNGNVLWTITVKGSFTYNGSTSKCTNSSVSVKSYVSNWTVSGAKAWKSGSTAYASAQGKMKNVLGQTTKTVNKQVSLTCSPSGKLS